MLRALICAGIAAQLCVPASFCVAAAWAGVRKPVPKAKVSKIKKSRKRAVSPWKAPTYADSTLGDHIDGEDLPVRRAAVQALGRYNGSVVVADPASGRILTIVNQRVALQSGFQPCSTIKLVTGLAALSEGVIERDTMLRLSRRVRLDLTSAMARSNNPFFANLGRQLGFERVTRYARLFGLGEKAGLDIEGELPGVLPQVPPRNGGVGMMTSFGEGISLTPLGLTSLLSAIANGGTLYYLQYPRSLEEVAAFVPRVKRQLDIAPWLDDIKSGMKAAVEYGTARRAAYGPEDIVMGKTGTCTDYRAATHLGWFGSFNDTGSDTRRKLAVVVLLTGGKPVNGAVAAGVAGAFYRNLSQESLVATAPELSETELLATQACGGC